MHNGRTVLRTIRLAAILGAGLVAAGPANAALITFDELTGKTTFFDACNAVSCPQTVVENTGSGNVTLTGGVILTETFGLASDTSSIYATSSAALSGVSGLINPITITFDNPVANFLVDVFNGFSVSHSYEVSDNAGHSSTFTLAGFTGVGGFTTIGFAATGTAITIADVTGVPDFDFGIDNIRFNVGITCTGNSCSTTDTDVPEPVTFSIFGAGLLGAAAARRKAKKA
jgi:hypothetical protein